MFYSGILYLVKKTFPEKQGVQKLFPLIYFFWKIYLRMCQEKWKQIQEKRG